MEHTLSNGRVGHFKRVDLNSLMVFGVMPESLTRIALRAAKGEMSDAELAASNETASVEDHLRSMIFYRKLFELALVSPRLNINATSSDELDPSALSFEEDILWNVRWQMQGCPGLSVRTTKGEVAHEDLASFRRKKSGKRPARTRKHNQRVRAES